MTEIKKITRQGIGLRNRPETRKEMRKEVKEGIREEIRGSFTLFTPDEAVEGTGSYLLAKMGGGMV